MKRKIFSVLFALVLVCSFSLVMAVPTSANTDRLVPSEYATIQLAIDAADPSDTIIVADGTYEESLLIEKALTIKSENGKESTTIQNVGSAPDAENTGISIRAGAFTLGGEDGHGFTIVGGTAGRLIQLTAAVSGVEISYNKIDSTGTASTGINIGAAGATDFTVSNNMFIADEDDTYQDWPLSASAGGGWITDLTITENVFTGSGTPDKYGAAIDLVDVQKSSLTVSTISDNTISGFDRGIIIDGESSPGTSDLLISQNDISGCAIGIRFKGTVDMTNVSVTENNISGNTQYGLKNECAAGVVTATNNWWGDASGPYLVNGVGDKISRNVDARVWLDAPYSEDATVCGQTTGLKVGETYDLYVEGTANTKVYLDDIDNDPLLPVDTLPGTYYSLEDDALVITLDADGKGVFANIKPEYATEDLDSPSTTIYIGISKTLASVDEIYWLEATPSAAFSLSLSPETATVTVETGITATVTDLDGEPMAGVMVKYGYDTPEVDNILDPGEIEGSSLTDSAGQYAFSITPDYAGNYIVVAVGANVDAGGKLGKPAHPTDGPDGIVDFSGERQSSVAVSASPTYALTVTPSTLYSGWTYGANTIEVVVKDSAGDLVEDTGTTYSASGCGITAIEDADPTIVDGTFTIAEEVHPTTTGSITLTVNRHTGGTSAADYTGSATITVSTADKFNVDISPSVIAAAAGSDITASFWDINMKGPDGAGTLSLLDNVKVTLSGAGVSETETINNLATHTFTGVTPEQAGTITATFVGTFDGSVETKTLDISVTGYKVVDLVPSTDQLIDTTSDISMTVTTKAGGAVNNATVTITAAETAGFKKDVIPGGGLESFQTIIINGAAGTIDYGAITPPTPLTEPFKIIVNNGFYEVTDITFAKPGAVNVKVEDTAPATMAELPTAFTVLGEDVYTLSFEPTMLTAGVDGTGLEITITEDSVAVTDVATITVDGVGKTFSRVSNVYTVTAALLYTEEKTGEDALTVIAQKADASEIGTASLEVALPSVSYVITDAAEIERDLMLTSTAYTVNVTAEDALGNALASGYIWLGTYADTTFTKLDITAGTHTVALPVHLDSSGEGSIDIDNVDISTAGTLVWKVGEGAGEGDAAVVLTPAITVEELYYDVSPTEAIVGVATTYTVTDNYGDPAADRDIKIFTPGFETLEKTTGPAGTPLAGQFNYTAPAAGNYYVSVKLDATTWQEAITVTVSEEAPPEDILAYYRAYSGDAEVVETTDLLKAANDWADEVVPSGFTEPISTTQLLTLANEWAATE